MRTVDTNNKKLMEMIGDMEPIEFIGLAKLLGVPLLEKKEGTDEFVPLDFSSVFSKVMSCFTALGRARKREILKLVQKSNSMKKRGKINASNTKNTESADVN